MASKEENIQQGAELTRGGKELSFLGAPCGKAHAGREASKLVCYLEAFLKCGRLHFRPHKCLDQHPIELCGRSEYGEDSARIKPLRETAE